MIESALAVEPAPNIGAMMAAAGDRLGGRFRKAMGVYVVAGGAYTLSRQWYDRIRSELTFVVSVDSRDDLYHDLHAWVLERVPPGRQRSLSARSFRSNGPSLVGQEDRHELRLAYDGRRSQVLRIRSHRVRVSVEQEDVGVKENDWFARLNRVVFTAYGAAARDAVVEVLRELARARGARRQVQFFAGSTWGDWLRQPDMPVRPLSSVVLRAGQSESISADLGGFLADEAAYARLGSPWHRGYLLQGPPGTGKTSLARALAAEHSLDVYFIPLGAIPNDAVLLRMLASVAPRSMLLLEDIDIVHGAKVRDDGEKGVSLSGLLNGLDGVLTPHGLVTVLTTNDASGLDPALLREGRVDVSETLGFLDDDQLGRLAASALGRPGCLALPPLGERSLSPAQVMGVFKANLGDDEAALVALKSLLAATPD